MSTKPRAQSSIRIGQKATAANTLRQDMGQFVKAYFMLILRSRLHAASDNPLSSS